MSFVKFIIELIFEVRLAINTRFTLLSLIFNFEGLVQNANFYHFNKLGLKKTWMCDINVAN